TSATGWAPPLEVNSLLPSDCALYLVEKFLGEGTFGKVAKCRDLTTNQEVAIKITKPSHRDSGLFELNALAEITKLDADKYCLIKFLDWFEYRSHICIVYEMLDQSLHDFMNIREHRPLLIHEIRTIARELLISLKGLKEINMAHRDIKPDNIMLVNQASEPFRVKLIDFGLAINPTDMETGTFMQNLRYRAPEVILGLPLDERVDMWTVGYTLAWLYTGFHIHSVDSEYTVIRSLTMRQGIRCCLSYDDLKNFYQDKTKMREMLEIDPNKRITPEEALKHSFFTMEQPSADSEKSNSQESTSKKGHPQPEKTTVPQEPAAAPQEKSRSEIKDDEGEKSNTQAGSRKRKRSVEQSQDPEQPSLTEKAVKKSRIEIKEDIIQQEAAKSTTQSGSRKRKRGVEQNQDHDHCLQRESAVKKSRIESKEDVLQQQEAAKSNSPAGSRKRKRSVEQSQDPEPSPQTESPSKKRKTW
uniref:Protein kinase domain-containing protein n=1 Tax=Oryzias melastigma TaxID=30732 RepID=A0A3B3DJ38_ORYME